jgi:cobalt-zinc-cadmium efflux system membrane fusion protein
MTSRWLALATVALLVAGCGESGPPQAAPKSRTPAAAETPPASPAMRQQVVAPEYRVRQTTLETTGKVQFNEDAVARIHTRATGRVIDVFVRPGDVVERGSRLLVLDSADLGAAKADYAKAVADVERSEAALRLARELFEVKAIAQKEIRDAESEARKTTAERERAAARLQTLGVTPEHFEDIAKRADAATTIIMGAPRGGVVVERNVSPGQVVEYGTGDTKVNMVVIADVSTMWVLADVYEPDVPKIQRGQTMTVTLPCCPGDRYEGPVDYISDMVDKDTRTVKVRAVVPNRGRSLKAEMFVRVALATGAARVLTIPQGAVHREGEQAYVFVPRGAEYERRPVKLGAELGGVVEVVAGLTPQDRVVGTGSILLKSTTK